MITRIVHVNVNVSDLDRSVAFYEALGWKVTGRADLAASEGSAVGLRVSPGVARCAFLKLDDNPDTPVLDMIEWQDPRTEGEAYRHLHHTGLNRLCMRSDDIWADYERLKAMGVEPWSEPAKLQVGASMVEFLCFEDPDGTVLELITSPGR